MKQEERYQTSATTMDEAKGPIREDVVERARRLLEDPDYPNIHVCRQLAQSLIPVLL